DRAQADVGAAVEAGLSGPKQDIPKQPTRKFIGRKTAEANARNKAERNGQIEESTAVQGLDSS
ncbi:MAG: hypothetical protein Q9204_009437, partial [Flavoplaca sp. TL-2023a]